MNFSEIFWKSVTYDNLKSLKKQGFTLSLENTYIENNNGVGQFEFLVSVCMENNNHPILCLDMTVKRRGGTNFQLSTAFVCI